MSKSTNNYKIDSDKDKTNIKPLKIVIKKHIIKTSLPVGIIKTSHLEMEEGIEERTLLTLL